MNLQSSCSECAGQHGRVRVAFDVFGDLQVWGKLLVDDRC